MASALARAALLAGYLPSSVEMEAQQLLKDACRFVRGGREDIVNHNLPQEPHLEHEYRKAP